MQLLRHAAHVFILRIWREPRDVEDAPAIWRGRIEHVTTEESRYFSTLDEALIFIAQKLGTDEENSPN
jgi:hypothetical protein